MSFVNRPLQLIAPSAREMEPPLANHSVLKINQSPPISPRLAQEKELHYKSKVAGRQTKKNDLMAMARRNELSILEQRAATKAMGWMIKAQRAFEQKHLGKAFAYTLRAHLQGVPDYLTVNTEWLNALLRIKSTVTNPQQLANAALAIGLIQVPNLSQHSEAFAALNASTHPSLGAPLDPGNDSTTVAGLDTNGQTVNHSESYYIVKHNRDKISSLSNTAITDILHNHSHVVVFDSTKAGADGKVLRAPEQAGAVCPTLLPISYDMAQKMAASFGLDPKNIRLGVQTLKTKNGQCFDVEVVSNLEAVVKYFDSPGAKNLTPSLLDKLTGTFRGWEDIFANIFETTPLKNVNINPPVRIADQPDPTETSTKAPSLEFTVNYPVGVDRAQADLTLAAIKQNYQVANASGRISVDFLDNNGRLVVADRVTYFRTERNELLTPYALDKIFAGNPALLEIIKKGIYQPSPNSGVMVELISGKIVYEKITFTRAISGLADLKDPTLFVRQVLAVVDVRTGRPIKLTNAGDVSFEKALAMVLPESAGSSGVTGTGNEVEAVRIFDVKTASELYFLIPSGSALRINGIRDYPLPANITMADLEKNPNMARNLVVSQNQASALVQSELVEKQKLGDKTKFSVVSFAENENNGRVVSIIKTTLDSQAAWLANGDGRSLWGVRLPPGTEISFENGTLVTDYQNQKIRFDIASNKWLNEKKEIAYPPAVIVNNPLGGEQNLIALLNPETSLYNAKRFYKTENPLGPLGGAIIKPEDALYVSQADHSKSGRGVGFQPLGDNGINIVEVNRINPLVQTIEGHNIVMITVTDGLIIRDVAIKLDGASAQLRADVPSNSASGHYFTNIRQDIPPELLFSLPQGTRIGIYGSSDLSLFNSSKPYYFSISGIFLFVN
ncbi:hypothetical protein HY030_01315 [Candidatus Gottesmanbacteria bacterium]|nr:hypothetical protein [Candidatus Gottesmanbacteria bacterium]